MGRSLWRVLGSWLVFSASHWMFMVASGVAAYDRDGATAVGLVAVARLVPALVAAPVAGMLVDRLDRSRVVMVSCGGATVALAAGSFVVSHDLPLGWLVAAIAATSVLGAAPRPALESLLPALAHTPADLVRATAWWSGVDSAGFLVGAGAGGVLLGLTAPGVAIGIAAGLAACTTLLAVALPRVVASSPNQGEDASGALAGIRCVISTPPLHGPFVLLSGVLVLEGCTDVQLVALAIDRLGLGDGGPGLLYLVWGVGGVIGSAVLLRIVRRTGYGRAVVVGALVFGLLLAVAGIGDVVVAVAVMLPVGLGFALVEGAVMGVVPRLADDAVIGRVYGVSELLYAGMAAFGACLAPAFIAWWGIGGSMVAIGAGYAVLALATWRRCARLDSGQQRATRVRDLLHDVAFLTPLPLPQLERLVRAARPVTVAAGDTVVAIGETGNEFFVIDTGDVDVREYGRRLGPGEGFGEIALIRDVPRTATVTARSEVHLWAVDRGPFLAALGASDVALATAGGVVDQHLSRRRRTGAVDDQPAES